MFEFESILLIDRKNTYLEIELIYRDMINRIQHINIRFKMYKFEYENER